jgi:hypothetical protein
MSVESTRSPNLGLSFNRFTVDSVRLKISHVLFFVDPHTQTVLIGGVSYLNHRAVVCPDFPEPLRSQRAAPLPHPPPRS